MAKQRKADQNGSSANLGFEAKLCLTADISLLAKVLVTPPELRKAMTCIMAPLIDQLAANRTQSRALATLRDILLPKLLSGDVCDGTSLEVVP